jgi:hypothetical protein
MPQDGTISSPRYRAWKALKHNAWGGQGWIGFDVSLKLARIGANE